MSGCLEWKAPQAGRGLRADSCAFRPARWGLGSQLLPSLSHPRGWAKGLPPTGSKKSTRSVFVNARLMYLYYELVFNASKSNNMVITMIRNLIGSEGDEAKNKIANPSGPTLQR